MTPARRRANRLTAERLDRVARMEVTFSSARRAKPAWRPASERHEHKTPLKSPVGRVPAR